MAIDTRAKRSSAVNPASPWRSFYPAGDGTIDQGDRQTVAFAYSGILAEALPSQVDTAEKRWCAINVGSPWRSIIPWGDGTISQADRQTVPFMYCGISAGAAEEAAQAAVKIRRFYARRFPTGFPK